VLARVDVDDPQRAALVAAGGDAVGHQPPVRAGPEPVDGRGGVAGPQVRIHDGAGRSRRGRAADHEHALVVAPPPLEREHAVPADRARHRRAGAEQRHQPVPEGSARGQGLQHRVGALVLRRHPRSGQRRRRVLEDPERVGHGHAVDDLGQRLVAQRWCRRDRRAALSGRHRAPSDHTGRPTRPPTRRGRRRSDAGLVRFEVLSGRSATGVGLGAVVRRLAPSVGLALRGLLRHGDPRYRLAPHHTKSHRSRRFSRHER
jgi:hypothetical protein